MARVVVRRLLWMPLVLLAVGLITFTLGLYGPGDPATVMLGQHNAPEVAERLRQQWGLDRPFYEQFGRYVVHAVQGDFGASFKYRRDISTLLAPRIWVSMQLAFAALMLAFVLGIPVGTIAAHKQGSWLDRALIGTSLLFISIPVFVLAPALQWLFVRQLHLLPTAGWDGLFSVKAILPAVVLGIPGIAGVARQTRGSVLEVLGQDYVRTAQSKGLPSRTIAIRHVLRNGLIPILTIFGLALGDLPAGALIVEGIFAIPGVGNLAFESIFARDYPVIMATTLVVGAGYVLANLAIDVTYPIVDPRIGRQ